jgi:hypothetical protein
MHCHITLAKCQKHWREFLHPCIIQLFEKTILVSVLNVSVKYSIAQITSRSLSAFKNLIC